MLDARFAGDATEPPVLMHCGYCGAGIRHGYDYYIFDTLVICDECACRYAWAQFIEQAQRVCALPENWL